MRVKTARLDSFPCFIGFLSWIRSDVLFLNFDQYPSKKSSYIKGNRRGRLPGRPESPDVLFIGTRRKRSPAEKHHESFSVYLNAVPTRTWNSAVRRTCLHIENAIIRCRYDAGTELFRQMNLSTRRKRPPAQRKRYHQMPLRRGHRSLPSDEPIYTEKAPTGTEKTLSPDAVTTRAQNFSVR